MRDHSNHIELSREDAVAAMLARCAFPAMGDARAEEIVTIPESLGRVLARDVVSLVEKPNALPPFSNVVRVLPKLHVV